MYVRQGSIVTALQSKPLSITATCFQYHEYGRRTGLKIRSPQGGVGSSPTFGTKSTPPHNPRKGLGAGRTVAQGGLPRVDALEWRILRSIPDDDARRNSALRGPVNSRCAGSPVVAGPGGVAGRIRRIRNYLKIGLTPFPGRQVRRGPASGSLARRVGPGRPRTGSTQPRSPGQDPKKF